MVWESGPWGTRHACDRPVKRLGVISEVMLCGIHARAEVLLDQLSMLGARPIQDSEPTPEGKHA